MKQAYIIVKRNEDMQVYDRILCNSYKEAMSNFRKNDKMLVCKEEAVYYGDNYSGWQCEEDGIIRVEEK